MPANFPASTDWEELAGTARSYRDRNQNVWLSPTSPRTPTW